MDFKDHIHKTAKPVRVYRSRLEAFPNSYPDWLEGPQRFPGDRLWMPAVIFLSGLALGMLLA